jgi:NADH pyrophosphatase NudC (nudix superfamily)
MPFEPAVKLTSRQSGPACWFAFANERLLVREGSASAEVPVCEDLRTLGLEPIRHQVLYSVLAGFVEAGETLEECVYREIREEVGVDVHNIRYFGSRSWPFPHSLMIAFTAEYAGGELHPDPSEITDAGWFGPARLPWVPEKISIARSLIDWFVESRAKRL